MGPGIGIAGARRQSPLSAAFPGVPKRELPTSLPEHEKRTLQGSGSRGPRRSEPAQQCSYASIFDFLSLTQEVAPTPKALNTSSRPRSVGVAAAHSLMEQGFKYPEVRRERWWNTRWSPLANWLVLSYCATLPAFHAQAEDVRGAYLLHGDAHVQVAPFSTGDYSGAVKATIERVGGPKRISVRLESHGYACVLRASCAASGSIVFSTPARCAVEISQPDARGSIEARLRSGRGTLMNGELALDLKFEISGNIAVRVPESTFRLLDAEITVPESWTPAMEVRGGVAARGRGTRQR